jgi:4-hydroxybenzoate polyprenyltransferase
MIEGRPAQSMPTILAWIQLFRFRYHLSYGLVMLGALHVRAADPMVALVRGYLAFGLLLYGGIYMLNAAADVRSDREHPKKRFRPVAAGTVRRSHAAIVGLCLIVAALVLARLWFSTAVTGWFAAFVGVNLLYTFGARAVPVLDILVNASTHPMRVMLGAALVDRMANPIVVAVVLLFAVGVATVRRVVEREEPGWQARPSLVCCPKRALFALRVLPAFALIVLLGKWPGVCALVLAAYLMTNFGLLAMRPTRSYLVRLWTA